MVSRVTERAELCPIVVDVSSFDAVRQLMPDRFLFLIPARGGSKGLPGKNVREVGGIPLVGRAARLGCAAARALGSRSRVVCSTDDSGIAEAARAWGAEVPFLRPPDLSSDSARTIDVVFHVLDTLHDQFDGVVLLQPTSPLTEVGDVLGAIALYRSNGLPVVAVCPAEHPAEWLFVMDADGNLTRVLQDRDLPTQRQAAQVSYRVNGAVYVCAPDTLRHQDSFFGPSTRGFLMPAARSVDVDSPLDLTIARAIDDGREGRSIELGPRTIARGRPSFVIGSLLLPPSEFGFAPEFVRQVGRAGADAVALQSSETAAVDRSAYETVLDACRVHNLPLISTAWDEKRCEMLAATGMAGLKLPPSAMRRESLLRHAAQTQKPIFLSTDGDVMATIARAVETLEEAGCQDLVLLHSFDNSRPNDGGGLRRLTALRQAFGVPVGVSSVDDNDAVIGAATALGASVLEKHLSAALAPSFGAMIRHVRAVESCLAAPSF